MSGGGLFETYEKEYCDLSGAITCDLNELQSGAIASEGARLAKLRTIDGEFLKLAEALRNMETELRSLPGPQKVKLATRMTNFQRDMTNLKKEYEKAKQASARRTLLAPGPNSSNSASAQLGLGPGSPEPSGDSRRMADTTDRLAKQNEKLTQALKLTAEMEVLGNNTKNNLVEQRERMKKTLGTVRDTSMEMSRARKFLTQIGRRAIVNKILLVGIILILILVIVLIVYFKWIRSSGGDSGGTTVIVTPPPEASPSPSPLGPDNNSTVPSSTGGVTKFGLRVLSALVKSGTGKEMGGPTGQQDGTHHLRGL